MEDKAVEEKYKPFWHEEKPEEVKLEKPVESKPVDGQDTIIKINASEHQANSFMDYLAKERLASKQKCESMDEYNSRKDKEYDEVFDQEDLNEDTDEEYDEPEKTPFPFFKIFMVILAIGAITLFGYLIFTSIQSQVFTQANNTQWGNYTETLGGTINNQFNFLNPFLTILMVGIALMIITRHRSIIPFLITFMMAMFAIIIFDASWLVMLIPGTILIFKTMRDLR